MTTPCPWSSTPSAQPGVRVRVKFSGQDLNGFLVARVAESESERLVPLARVYSAVPVLTPQVLELARKVAARYAGTVADVLRVAVPPRVASLEKIYLKGASGPPADAAEAVERRFPPPHPGRILCSPTTPHAEDFLAQLAMGASPKAVFGALHGWGPRLVAPPAGPGSWPTASSRAAAPLWWSPICVTWSLLERAFATVLAGGQFCEADGRRRPQPALCQLPAGPLPGM